MTVGLCKSEKNINKTGQKGDLGKIIVVYAHTIQSNIDEFVFAFCNVFYYISIMFVRKSTSKRKDKAYSTYQIVESYREEGKVKQRILLHLGAANQLTEEKIDSLIGSLLHIRNNESTIAAEGVKSYGQIWALMHIWKELKITETVKRLQQGTKIEFDIDKHLQAMVFNRIDDPGSKLKLLSWLETVYMPEVKEGQIKYENLLRAMDFLIKNKEQIEKQIADKYLTIFNTEIKVCFYDITSTYFEAENSITQDDIRRKGYSRDNRSDREQVVIGVVMTQDGVPLCHYTFEGNTIDSKTVKTVVEDIRERFGVKSITIVGDKGMTSRENIEDIIEKASEFILGESKNKSQTAKEVIIQASANREIKGEEIYESTAEKEITIKDSQGNPQKKKIELRYVCSYNAATAERNKQSRERRISIIEEEIKKITEKEKRLTIQERYKKIKNKIEDYHLTKLIKVEIKNDQIQVRYDEEEIKYARKKDGWFMVITNNKKLSKELIIEKYKELKYVEHGFREIKHSLELRPNYHWTKNRINAHIMICFMAFQIAQFMERRIKPSKMSWEKCIEKIRRVSVIKWNYKEKPAITNSNKDQIELFTLIGCKLPKV